jgi:hypothetical protein
MSYRKEIVTAAGTLACAVGIGFIMQSSEAADQRYGGSQNVVPSATQMDTESAEDTMLEVQSITLTSGELENMTKLPELDAQIMTVSAPQSILPEPQIPEMMAPTGCKITASARPIAAAVVDLVMSAPCLPNERATVHHNGMIFTQTTSDKGMLEIEVPALSEQAVFIIAFSNGEGAVAQTEVPELADYDRVALQWKGETGLQIHAREFGAAYGSDGDVWIGAPRDKIAAVTGRGGFIARNGDQHAAEPLMAEVYTFPRLASEREGEVHLSVEAEVVDANCGLEIEAQSLQILGAKQIKTKNLTLAVPDCDAKGSFLVLNNLLQDLKVARN